MADMPMEMPAGMQETEGAGEKCFAIWVAEDGTASVAEIPAEHAMQMKEQVEAMPAKSQGEAMQMLSEMMPTEPDTEEQDVMRGYEKSAKPMNAAAPQKIFGE